MLYTVATIPASDGMTQYYGVSNSFGLPWAASLGNHDDGEFSRSVAEQSSYFTCLDSITMRNRSAVIEYVVSLPGSLSEVGPVPNSYGNYVLEIFPSQDALLPSFRTYHFDSDDKDSSITADQVAWYLDTAAQLNANKSTPALAFYHIPIEEYYIATAAGIEFTGGYHETICYQPVNNGVFEAFKNNDVKAGFCGHDHTNDFCVPFEGVKLCYEGSPGFQAYGSKGYPRKARVTELRSFGSEIVSWKRLDTSIGGGAIEDVEILWQANAEDQESARKDKATVRRSVTKEYISSLPHRYQKH